MDATLKPEAQSRVRTYLGLLAKIAAVTQKDAETLDIAVDKRSMWWRLMIKFLRWNAEPLSASDWLMAWYGSTQ